jgi:hypothetical protein
MVVQQILQSQPQIVGEIVRIEEKQIFPALNGLFVREGTVSGAGRKGLTEQSANLFLLLFKMTLVF